VETDAGLKGIHIYNVAGGIGVRIHDSGTGQSLAPTIEGCTFIRCDIGVEALNEWVRSEAVIKDCLFDNKAEGARSPLPSGNTHIRIETSGESKGGLAAQFHGTIDGCTLRGDVTTGSMFYGIYLKATEGTLAAKIRSCRIGNVSPALPNPQPTNGMARGIYAWGGGTSGYARPLIEDTTVDGCYTNGIHLESTIVTGVAAQSLARIERCLIINNGRSQSPPTQTDDHENPKVAGGHGVFVHATERGRFDLQMIDCHPQYGGGIHHNSVDGVYIGPDSGVTGTIAAALNTKTVSYIHFCEIHDNGRFGLVNFARTATADCQFDHNIVHHNYWGGVANVARNPNESQNPGAGLARIVSTNNLIYGKYPGNPEQRQLTGIINDRWEAWSDGEFRNWEAKILLLNDTVVYHDGWGVDMHDALFENNKGSEIKNGSITNNSQTGVGGDVLVGGVHGFWGTVSTVQYTVFREASEYHGTGESTNLDTDYVTVGYVSPSNYNFRLDLNLSQVVDQASNPFSDNVPGGVDLDFLPRQVDKGRAGIWGYTDMGAYEVQ
jgi:hypothetical protein